jgi:hypothetical protein
MRKTDMLYRFALVPVLCCLCATEVWADNGVGGRATTVDVLVTSNVMWTPLVAETFTVIDETTCIATGSADALNPNVMNNSQYRFTLALIPNPGVNSRFERTVEFDINGVGREEVSSTAIFGPLDPGTYTIHWLARKVAAAAPNMTVTDNSMTFVCNSNLLHDDEGPDGN